MIKAILVDDEQLAVELLTHYLKATRHGGNRGEFYELA